MKSHSYSKSMRLPRTKQFDKTDPPWLHCISRCVRRAYLCGDGYEHRKKWLERRLKLLSRCFAADIAAYAIMSNHMHVVIQPQPQRADAMSAQEIASAWWCIRNNVDPIDDVDANPIDQAAVDKLVTDEVFIADWRKRLGDVGWFMRSFKEPLSRMANAEDKCTGAFWEGRFKSVPLLDLAAVVTCMAYVDLNPIRAQLAAAPESSEFTSVKARIDQRRARQRAIQKRQAGERTTANKILTSADISTQVDSDALDYFGSAARKKADNESLYRSWLMPVCEATITYKDSPYMGFGLETYLKIVDNTGRLLRENAQGTQKGHIHAELAGILQRLDQTISVDDWMDSVAQPHGLRGAVLGTVASMAAEAKRRGLEWMQVRTGLFRANGKKAGTKSAG